MQGILMSGWTEFLVAFLAFFATHAFPVRPPLKPLLVARLGSRGFTIAYSLLSLAVLAWLLSAAHRAPVLQLWPWAAWQNLVPIAMMLPVCLILTLSVGRPNPFSFGGANNGMYNPTRPGIIRVFRHPMLAALMLWSVAHILPNGDLAHVILFSVFAAFAWLGRKLITRRKKRRMMAAYRRLSETTASNPPRPMSWGRASLRLAGGIILYAGLLCAHPFLFGVSPLI
jgi:uncharacterized membrane protein